MCSQIKSFSFILINSSWKLNNTGMDKFVRKWWHCVPYWGWVWGHQGWGFPPDSGTGCCHSPGSSAALVHTCTATPGRTLGDVSRTHHDCQNTDSLFENGTASATVKLSVCAGIKSDSWVNVFSTGWTTHTAIVASPAWLWLNLQKVFQRVSTSVNCRLTITSSMAWEKIETLININGVILPSQSQTKSQ